jgi:hypothetical protein
MLAEGKVGLILAADGSPAFLTFARTGGARVQQAHAKYHDGTSRNRRYTACTGAAGVAPGTALSTTPPLVVWNPTNSGVLAVLDKVALGYISGTLGAGSIVAAFTPQQVTLPSGGTLLVPQNNFLSNAKPSCTAHQGSTLTAAPTILRPLWIMGAALATTAFEPRPTEIDLEGSIVISPGCAYAMQGIAAAGTTPLVLLSATWEEVPLLGTS